MSQYVLFIGSKTEWCAALNQLKNYDFVHTYDFHNLAQLNGEGQPLLFALIDDSKRVVACWPVLRRSIEGTPFFDLSSVYGYGGPIFAEGIDVELALTTLLESMRKQGFISLFSRMHPLYVEEIKVDDMRGQKLSDVILIDLHTASPGLGSYRGSHRREILNAQKKGVKVVVDPDCSRMSDFSKIYIEAMLQLDAKKYYHFSDEYFEILKRSSDFKTILIYAELNGVMIAASLFILTNKVLQYYLSGTLASYRKLAPSKLIIAEAHQLAINLGVNEIILGGGVGSMRDALFDFKAGFSGVTKPFYVVRKIFNENIYSSLCFERGVDSRATSFFPAYRA